MINLFPTDRAHQIRTQLSPGSRAIPASASSPRAAGRAAAPGGGGGAREHPAHPQADPGRRNHQDSRRPSRRAGPRGMQTFNQALTDLVKSGAVSEEEALSSPSPREPA